MSAHVIEIFHLIADLSALGIEMLAVALIVAAVIILTIQQGAIRHILQIGKPGVYDEYKHQLGKALLLGLELMVAADVVRTVTFDPTLANVAVLGLLVLVRTFLSWAMSVEIEGHWPWQARPIPAADKTPTKPE
jgi:uncharacterized membrane protein